MCFFLFVYLTGRLQFTRDIVLHALVCVVSKNDRYKSSIAWKKSKKKNSKSNNLPSIPRDLIILFSRIITRDKRVVVRRSHVFGRTRVPPL